MRIVIAIVLALVSTAEASRWVGRLTSTTYNGGAHLRVRFHGGHPDPGTPGYCGCVENCEGFTRCFVDDDCTTGTTTARCFDAVQPSTAYRGRYACGGGRLRCRNPRGGIQAYVFDDGSFAATTPFGRHSHCQFQGMLSDQAIPVGSVIVGGYRCPIDTGTFQLRRVR